MGSTAVLFYVQINKIVFAVITLISFGGFFLGMLSIGQMQGSLTVELINEDSINSLITLTILVVGFVFYSLYVSKSVEIRLLKQVFSEKSLR